MKKYIQSILITVGLITCAAFISCNSQHADPDFDVTVSHPAYTERHPKVLFDEAHNNVHTTTGTYRPFARLIGNDGYAVTANDDRFSESLLKEYEVLVISAAKGKEQKDQSAFSDDECNIVAAWVHQGGSLLLITDHHPIGGAAQNLAARFGVSITNGFASDSLHYQGSVKWKDELVFSRSNGYLGDHIIMDGRSANENINKLVSFTGTSLKGPDSATVLLRLSDAAQEIIKDSVWEQDGETYTQFTDPVSASGRNQGFAMSFGKGRVIILGEAGMMTAQISPEDTKFGMNVLGIDNKQFVLNTMHWLSHLLE